MSFVRRHKYGAATFVCVLVSSALFNVATQTRGYVTVIFGGLLGFAWSSGYMAGRRDKLDDYTERLVEFIAFVKRQGVGRGQ